MSEPTANMEVQDRAVLKKNRAVRKGKMTIALNELHAEMKEKDVVAEQIRLLLERAKTRFDAVEDAHDALVDTIMDEEELSKEEEWLGVVVNDYNKVTRFARKLLGEVGSTPVKPGINVRSEIQGNTNLAPETVENVNVQSVTKGSNDDANVDSSVKVVETQEGNIPVNTSNESVTNLKQDNSHISMVQAMALPKAQVRKFNDDPLFYHSFISTFNNSVSCILDPSVKLNVLRSLCSGRALDSTEYCVLKPPEGGLQAALKTLKERFGNSALIVQAWVQKIVARPKVEPSKLEGFADDLTNCFQALEALGYLNELNNQGSLKTIIEKLPKFLQQRWTREVFKLRENNQIPSLKNVVKFVRSASCELNDPVFSTAADKSTKPTEKTTTHRVFKTETRAVTQTKPMEKWKKCWGCDSDEHWPDQCSILLGLTPNERMKQAKECHVCFACFKKAGRTHSMQNCRRRKKCLHCEKFHHPLLHTTTTQTHQLMTHDLSKSEDTDIVMPMLTAEVSGKNCNVLLDTCATLTLIRDQLAKECQFPSKPITVEITTLGSERTILHTRAYNVTIASKEGTRHNFTAVGVPSITDVPKINERLKSDVEKKLNERIDRGSGTVDILIGINYPKMHAGRWVDMGDYIARKSPLGWVLFGSTSKSTSQQHNPVLLVNLAQPVDMSQFWSTEEMGVRLTECKCAQKDVTLSPDDNRKFAEMWDSCEKGEDGRWTMPYPWVKPPECLPNNEKQCYAKLCSLEKMLKKTSKAAEQYNEAIEDLVNLGFAKKLSKLELNEYQGPVHYIPHHAVIRPDNTSTPIRIVFNSSSVCNGASLNDHIHKGPDLLNNLMGVITRFREQKVAVAGDISKMFYQVKIPTRDMHIHRFLWRNFEQRTPDTYVLTIVTPGDKPAPAMAITALLKTAKENEDAYPDAARVLRKDTYMDDICTSVNDDKAAVEITKDIEFFHQPDLKSRSGCRMLISTEIKTLLNKVC